MTIIDEKVPALKSAPEVYVPEITQEVNSVFDENNDFSQPKKQFSDEKSFFGNLIDSILGWFDKLFGKKDENAEQTQNDKITETTEPDKSTEASEANENTVLTEIIETIEEVKNKNSVNGVIDEPFKQGGVGDCNLLATLQSFAYTQEGAQIIKDAITINKDANGEITSYDVYFRGIDETYTITAQELEEHNSDEYHKSEPSEYVDEYGNKWTGESFSPVLYSYGGDDDVLLLEMAVEKCLQESDKINSTIEHKYERVLDGVSDQELAFLFAIDEDINVVQSEADSFKEYSIDSYQEKLDNLKKGRIGGLFCQESIIKDINGNDIKFEDNELISLAGYNEDVSEYTIVKYYTSDGEYSEMEYVVSIEELAKLYTAMTTTSSNYDEYKEAINSVNNGNAAVLSISAEVGGKFLSKDVNGQDIELYSKHAYAIKSATRDTITFVNPHDTSEDIVMYIDDLKNIGYKTEITTYDFN